MESARPWTARALRRPTERRQMCAEKLAQGGWWGARKTTDMPTKRGGSKTERRVVKCGSRRANPHATTAPLPPAGSARVSRVASTRGPALSCIRHDAVGSLARRIQPDGSQVTWRRQAIIRHKSSCSTKRRPVAPDFTCNGTLRHLRRHRTPSSRPTNPPSRPRSA